MLLTPITIPCGYPYRGYYATRRRVCARTEGLGLSPSAALEVLPVAWHRSGKAGCKRGKHCRKGLLLAGTGDNEPAEPGDCRNGVLAGSPAALPVAKPTF